MFIHQEFVAKLDKIQGKTFHFTIIFENKPEGVKIPMHLTKMVVNSLKRSDLYWHRSNIGKRVVFSTTVRNEDSSTFCKDKDGLKFYFLMGMLNYQSYKKRRALSYGD